MTRRRKKEESDEEANNHSGDDFGSGCPLDGPGQVAKGVLSTTHRFPEILIS